MTRQEELTDQGWQRQATYDEPRLSEMAEMYKDIGLEVHLEPFQVDDQPGLRLAPCIWSLALIFEQPEAGSQTLTS